MTEVVLRMRPRVVARQLGVVAGVGALVVVGGALVSVPLGVVYAVILVGWLATLLRRARVGFSFVVRPDRLTNTRGSYTLDVPWGDIEGLDSRRLAGKELAGLRVRAHITAAPKVYARVQAKERDRFLFVGSYDAGFPASGPVADALRRHRPDLLGPVAGVVTIVAWPGRRRPVIQALLARWRVTTIFTTGGRSDAAPAHDPFGSGAGFRHPGERITGPAGGYAGGMPMRWLYVGRSIGIAVLAAGAVAYVLSLLWGGGGLGGGIAGGLASLAFTVPMLRRRRLTVEAEGLHLTRDGFGLIVPWSAIEGPSRRLGVRGLALGEGVRRTEPSKRACRYLPVSSFDAGWPTSGPVAEAVRAHRPDLAASS